METRIVYCDETGDDGNNTLSSQAFVLTSLCIQSELWQSNFDKFKRFRKKLKAEYDFSLSDEMHTQPFMTNKNPFRNYNWSAEVKRHIISDFTSAIGEQDVLFTNVIINKTVIKRFDYNVLGTALTYNIQRIENTSKGQWNYLIVTDPGRTGAMNKIARKIRAYNPVPFFDTYANRPIKLMVEDILEKDSKESYFIQMCDFVSYFVNAYFKIKYLKEPITGRASNIIGENEIMSVMDQLKCTGKLNLLASHQEFGIVIYPK